MSYRQYYDRQREVGEAFQDYVAQALYRRGIILINFGSRKYQFAVGENILGAEIKRDSLFRKYNQLYIETAEKADPDNDDYVESGIYRSDNSWLYIIGDEETFWVFSITLLRLLNESLRYTTKEKPTSRAFVLPLADADKYAAFKWERSPTDSYIDSPGDSEQPSDVAL